MIINLLRFARSPILSNCLEHLMSSGKHDPWAANRAGPAQLNSSPSGCTVLSIEINWRLAFFPAKHTCIVPPQWWLLPFVVLQGLRERNKRGRHCVQMQLATLEWAADVLLHKSCWVMLVCNSSTSQRLINKTLNEPFNRKFEFGLLLLAYMCFDSWLLFFCLLIQKELFIAGCPGCFFPYNESEL